MQVSIFDSHDGDACAIRVRRMGADLAYNLCESYFLPTICGDVLVADHVEGLDAIDYFDFSI